MPLDADQLRRLASIEHERQLEPVSTSVDAILQQLLQQTQERFATVAPATVQATELSEEPNATHATHYQGDLVLAATPEFIDDFELLAQLGKGSFATVYLARQTSMQRRVALKVSTDLGSEPQTLAQLDHPNIVRVYDQKRHEPLRVNLLYMQYVAGGTLLDVINYLNQQSSAQRDGHLFIAAIDRSVDNRGESPSYNAILRKHFEKM